MALAVGVEANAWSELVAVSGGDSNIAFGPRRSSHVEHVRVSTGSGIRKRDRVRAEEGLGRTERSNHRCVHRAGQPDEVLLGERFDFGPERREVKAVADEEHGNARCGRRFGQFGNAVVDGKWGKASVAIESNRSRSEVSFAWAGSSVHLATEE